MPTQDELAFYDLKSEAESALRALRKNCELTGRDWDEELDDVIVDAERD